MSTAVQTSYGFGFPKGVAGGLFDLSAMMLQQDRRKVMVLPLVLVLSLEQIKALT